MIAQAPDLVPRRAATGAVAPDPGAPGAVPPDPVPPGRGSVSAAGAPGSRQAWEAANQAHLMAEVARVGEALDRHARLHGSGRGEAGGRASATAARDAAAPARAAVGVAAAGLEPGPPPALDHVCSTFGLSPFERDVVLLCAGVELDGTFGDRCAAAHGSPDLREPTFGLALAALPDGHWSALAPSGPLRRWRLVEHDDRGALVEQPLRVDERVLHFLAGVQHLDQRLTPLVDPLPPPPEPLSASQSAVAARATEAWAHAGNGPLPVLQLAGRDRSVRLAVAADVCARSGLPAWQLAAGLLPSDPAALDAFVALWAREAALTGSALVVDADDLDGEPDRATVAALRRLVQRVDGPLIVSLRDPRPEIEPHSLAFEVDRPTPAEQADIWRRHLRDAAVDGEVEALAGQFDLAAPAIHAAAAEAAAARADGGEDEGSRSPRLGITPADARWDACRRRSRPRVEALAQRVVAGASWDDLVLPPEPLTLLRELAIHVRHRSTVLETWGFRAAGRRGLGVSALFAGPSGTGKTMAAEVLATHLRLDLYRVDLSQVVSKYIGETEKNLRQVFDAAEGGGAVLLFDEAEALFGKRSEVKDSHDRYANIEVSYLLQRMEAYRGLAILTTNMKEALDPAFLRRIRFVVAFPFPDVEQRAGIWSRVFPPSTPVEALDVGRLARLNLAGGSIANVALGAAFRAASEGSPVRMRHLAVAARAELAKLEKPIVESEVAAWS